MKGFQLILDILLIISSIYLFFRGLQSSFFLIILAIPSFFISLIVFFYRLDSIISPEQFQRKKSIRKATQLELKRLDSLFYNDYSKAEDLMKRIQKCISIANETTDIDVYFSTFDDLLVFSEALISFEKKVSFSGSPPTKSRNNLLSKEQPSIHDFLKRAANKRASEVYGQTPNARSNAFESFCEDLQPYIFRFDAKNKSFLRHNCKAIFEIPPEPKKSSESTKSEDSDLFLDNVVLLKEAINVVMKSGAASATLLQRKLQLGYGRAARIMDQLEELGIVSPANGAHPRKILITQAQAAEIIDRKAIDFLTKKNDDMNSKETKIDQDSFFGTNPSGYEFEKYCCELLKNNGFTNVNQTKLSGDDGVDILAEKDDIKYAIQCKYYSSPVGNKAVQEAFTGAQIYHCDIAVVMTNSTFTPQAIRTAKETHVRLWDKEKLSVMLHNKSN